MANRQKARRRRRAFFMAEGESGARAPPKKRNGRLNYA
jgi:hypothetical protein